MHVDSTEVFVQQVCFVNPLASFCLLQGVILEHREIEFGDKVNVLEVLNAVGRIQRELVSLEER